MTRAEPLWYRSRGLDALESRFGAKRIAHFIEERSRHGRPVRILEIGFGEVRCLLEIAERSSPSDVELFGINDRKRPSMSRKADLAANAARFGLHVPLRRILSIAFYDGGSGLRFADRSIDLVISQVSVPYVTDKARLYEEVWRVLAPDGRAFLHVDSDINERFPEFMRHHRDTPRTVVYADGRLVSTRSVIERARKEGYEVRLERSRTKPDNLLLLMRKNRRARLDLGLSLDERSTIPLWRLKDTDAAKRDASVWWGTRSVYVTRS